MKEGGRTELDGRTKDGLVVYQSTWVRKQKESKTVKWKGPLAILVNRRTLSNGDMCAMGFARQGHIVVGFEGTSGSVSFSGGLVKMPLMEVEFTLGQSWDANMNIQIEADARGILKLGVGPAQPMGG